MVRHVANFSLRLNICTANKPQDQASPIPSIREIVPPNVECGTTVTHPVHKNITTTTFTHDMKTYISTDEKPDRVLGAPRIHPLPLPPPALRNPHNVLTCKGNISEGRIPHKIDGHKHLRARSDTDKCYGCMMLESSVLIIVIVTSGFHTPKEPGRSPAWPSRIMHIFKYGGHNM